MSESDKVSLTSSCVILTGYWQFAHLSISCSVDPPQDCPVQGLWLCPSHCWAQPRSNVSTKTTLNPILILGSCLIQAKKKPSSAEETKIFPAKCSCAAKSPGCVSFHRISSTFPSPAASPSFPAAPSPVVLQSPPVPDWKYV